MEAEFLRCRAGGSARWPAACTVQYAPWVPVRQRTPCSTMILAGFGTGTVRGNWILAPGTKLVKSKRLDVSRVLIRLQTEIFGIKIQHVECCTQGGETKSRRAFSVVVDERKCCFLTNLGCTTVPELIILPLVMWVKTSRTVPPPQMSVAHFERCHNRYPCYCKLCAVCDI